MRVCVRMCAHACMCVLRGYSLKYNWAYQHQIFKVGGDRKRGEGGGNAGERKRDRARESRRE